MNARHLSEIINKIIQPAKGILAADESLATITKRFESIRLEPTEENRRAYRELLFTTPGLSQYISGIILFEESLQQKTTSGLSFVQCLEQQDIVPGIKVDKGLIPLVNVENDKITQGLDGLTDRVAAYKSQGAKFAKWRAVFQVSPKPSSLAIKTNANSLGMYAAICQHHAIVPIVEPEILIDGSHTLAECAAITEEVLRSVFKALAKHNVLLEYIVLKPSMVLPGKTAVTQNSISEIAQATIGVFRRTVPAAVPSINFLSGGQSPEQATAILNAIHQLSNQPWNLSFSYGRALQDPCLKIWEGKTENNLKAQQALLKRARLNSAAMLGSYDSSQEV
ncbi:fructose-bisphosphate aldolase class I [Candidatus Berkiella cookevillensis]|uniref:Probable fructose-bisphosphate aldolase class 1 n=1 Tax=Candidatus Berkiella cookevillensis TaxID=437022 RepID=A0AAE3HPW0_9GAMM|nr:class I fructose-bisphosphate aldolase [Candidatus Berkiella cookevillensis]MCS5708461.1 fructose-bisphosphate aldolase class I [Candidatus Berkiella cookevillensis]